MDDFENNVFVDDEGIYNKDIKTVPKQDKSKDIDLDGVIYDDIIEASEDGTLNVGALESLNGGAENRNQMYNMYDVMCEDGNIESIVEAYVNNSTERNENGDIVWCTSSDEKVAKMVSYLLDTMNVNKNIDKWAYSLVKYGDLYLRLYRESEYDMGLLRVSTKKTKKKDLKESIVIKAYKDSDKYAHYLEMVSNPAKMFELTKHGKSMGYVEASVDATLVKQENTIFNTFRYQFKPSDVVIYPATEFVHATLGGGASRVEESINITFSDPSKESNIDTFNIRRGDSILSNVYKIWRNLSLLEASVLLNRVTKSSVLRLINVEVGDMPKENVEKVLARVKTLMEQKMALNKGIALSDYTNPGPIENNVYIPTRNINGVSTGAVSTTQIGGDVDVKSLADLDYYINKLYGSLGVPKQFFGWTDDSTGFNGGTSLTIISSQFAKDVKRIQTSLLEALTDAINLMLLDKGLESYVNNFTLEMVRPTTQEDIDRQDNMANKVQLTSDIMGMLNDIEDPVLRLKIVKSMLAPITNNTELIGLIQDGIDGLESNSTKEEETREDQVEEEKEPTIDLNVFDNRARSPREERTIKFPVKSTSEIILPNPEQIDMDGLDAEV